MTGAPFFGWRSRLAALAGAVAWSCSAVAATPAATTAMAGPAAAMPSGESSPIADAAALAFWWGNFDELERQYLAVRASPDLVDGGTLKLEWFRQGLVRVLDADGQHDPYLAQLEALTHAWSVEHPSSALAQLLYARALYARGYKLRGGDVVDKTPAAAMAPFDRYLALAETQLADHAELLRNESTTYVYLALFARWHRPFEDVQSIVRAGLKTNRNDIGGYVELASAALPRWGGDYPLFDAVAREAAARVGGYDGQAVVAILYDDKVAQFDGAIFGDSQVDWPTLRQGYRDDLARYPNFYMLNRFARMACLAEDKPTTLRLLDQIGPKPSQNAWGQRFDACRRWALSP